MRGEQKKLLLFGAVFVAFCVMLLKVTGGQVGGMAGTGGFPLDDGVYLEGEGVSMAKKCQVLEGLGFALPDELKEMEGGAEIGYVGLLSMLGFGEYDFDTLEWTPTSDKVYALDMEVFNIGAMYPDFFAGLLSISGGELPITDVVQDDSGVDQEQGVGTVRVSLEYDGRPYSFELQGYFDWLDADVLREVNRILKQEGVERRFYAMTDGYQMLLVFYCDKAWADQFRRETGCRLYTEV